MNHRVPLVSDVIIRGIRADMWTTGTEDIHICNERIETMKTPTTLFFCKSLDQRNGRYQSLLRRNYVTHY